MSSVHEDITKTSYENEVPKPFRPRYYSGHDDLDNEMRKKYAAAMRASAAKPKTEVLVFYSRDDVDRGAERAKALVKSLGAAGIATQLVHKLGFDLDQLHTIARHRVVSTPTVLILKADKVVYRRVGLPTLSAIIRALGII